MRPLLLVSLVIACARPGEHISTSPDTPDSSVPPPDAALGDAPSVDAAGPRTLRIGAGSSTLAAWDFGLEEVGSASTALALTVTNDTDAVSGTLVVTSSADFPLDASSSCAQNLQLAPGASCSILVRFQPKTTGLAGASLQVDGGPQVGQAAIGLSGSGTSAPDLDTVPPFVDFGAVEFGTSVERTLVMTNAGDDLQVTAVSVTDPIGSGHSLASTTCIGALAHGASCDLVVRFQPVAFGQNGARLDVATDHGPYAIGTNWLMGRGAARLTVQKQGQGTVTSDGGGVPNVDCGPTCDGLFTDGPTHTLTQSDGVFQGWGGAGASCGSADTCTVDLSTTKAIIVRAVFSL